MNTFNEEQILYEDNHLIVINKRSGQITQGDKTGDTPLPVLIQDYIRSRDHRPGNVFCGVVHRLDRPVSGVVLFARTSKALSRMNEMVKQHDFQKTYWVVTRNAPPLESGRLEHWLRRNESQNKSFVVPPDTLGAKKAILDYRLMGISKGGYYLLEVDLLTGRHHQIRAQLAHIGCPIQGDLKYGSKRPMSDGSIMLHARQISFLHPVRKEPIVIVAPTPNHPIWADFEMFNS